MGMRMDSGWMNRFDVILVFDSSWMRRLGTVNLDRRTWNEIELSLPCQVSSGLRLDRQLGIF